ncbi:hypothetical protein JVT61DRAFT_14582 [Boletus reticuloceps]|uniref:Uncharacterized protein n=1 Tax=Boletus reticuloceps TaxID=495285 RepID=A0A8I3ABX5_9AGAM|nr:hypothetical protein JVT61DRAFT_14582 [Boletus reticuloceps]
MPNCPRCYKSFPNNKSIAFHRAQPTSACNTNHQPERSIVHVHDVDIAAAGMSSQSIEDSEHLYDSEGLSRGEAEWDVENTDENLAAHWNVDDSMNESPGTDLDEGPLLFNPADMEPEPIFPAIQTLRFATGWAVDLCPNAERAAGDGQTFLAKFRQDEFAPYRTLNLYYPFSSPEDWQMANFLLTSHLSMRAINDFLSLNLAHLLSWLHCTLFSNFKDSASFVPVC